MATIKMRIGRVTGTLESAQQEVTVFNDDQSALEYQPALDYVKAQLLGVTIFGMTRNDDKINVVEKGKYTYTFEIVYESSAIQNAHLPPATPTDGTIREASSFAKAVKLTDFIAPVGVFATGNNNNVSNDYPGLKFKIDASGQDSHYHRSSGVVFNPLPVTYTRKYYPKKELVTNVWLKQIEEFVARGAFNAAEFDGYPPGSLQLVQFHAQPRNSKDWEFIYGFGHRPPRFDIDVGGGVVIPELRGNYYYWTRDVQTYNAAKKILQPQTKLAVVGKVWDEMSFALLGVKLV